MGHHKKIVLLTNSNPNQIALACKLDELEKSNIRLSAIIVSQNISRKPKKKTLLDFANKLNNRTLGIKFSKSWRDLMKLYSKEFPAFPDTKKENVYNINDSKTTDWIEELNPNLVLVSGTNLLSSKTIKSIQKICPIMNLHTGISPYIKGGPNCTNWCLAIGRPDLIGNTVMWIDSGIDTGHLIATERTPLSGSESIVQLHKKVMDHAHDLYISIASQFLSGEELPNKAQKELGEGQTFFTRDWSVWPTLRALMNYKKFFGKEGVKKNWVFQNEVLLPRKNDTNSNTKN